MCRGGKTLHAVEATETRAALALWLKNDLSRQHPSLPDQPRCVIDLGFCFTPAIPEKVEVFKNSGRLRGDQSACLSLSEKHGVLCVCVRVCRYVGRGINQLMWSVFFPQQNLRRLCHTESLVICQHCLQILIIPFPLGLLGTFSAEFDTISKAQFFCSPSTSAQDESPCAWLCFPGAEQLRSCDEWRETVSMQQWGLDGSLISSFFLGTHTTY